MRTVRRPIITRLEDLNVADKYHVFAQNGSEVGAQLMKDGSLEFTIASSPGLEGAVAVFAGIDGVKNGKEPNQLIACPIASVTPDLADDPEAIISWSVDEEAWGAIIRKAFLIMQSFSKRPDRHLHRHQYGVWKR